MARAAWLTLITIAAASLGGCQQGPAPVAEDGPAPFPPPYAEIQRAHNARIERLSTLESGGNIELRWTDPDGGSHFEQGDIKLVWRLPRDLALRIYKFDTKMWLGSDDDQFWFFDLVTGEESVAYVGEFSGNEDDAGSREIPGMLQPMRLLDLMALSPLPEGGSVAWDPEEDAWRIEAAGRGGPVRIFLDRASLLPLRVDSLGDGGEPLYRSRHERHEKVPAEGIPYGDYPRIATRVSLVEPGADGEAVLFLDQPTARIDERRLDIMTDLDRLMSSLRPDRVELVGARGDS